MSEIVTAILAIAVAAQVAIMAKAGKDILNSGLRESMYGGIETREAQQVKQDDKTDDSAGLKSETEIGYTYTDDQNYGHKDDENEAERLEANAESKHSLKLSL